MISISKEEQVNKIKRISTKKMSAVELQLYKDFINDITEGKCQCCGNTGVEYHHALFGAYKSDTSLVLICREEHHTIHHGINTKEAERLKVLTKGIGRSNWRRYTSE